jgi:hypothetical protein
MELEDDGTRFTVRICDPAADPAAPPAPRRPADPGEPPHDPDVILRARAEEEAVALALVRGLADRVQVGSGPRGAAGLVVMTWNRR